MLKRMMALLEIRARDPAPDAGMFFKTADHIGRRMTNLSVWRGSGDPFFFFPNILMSFPPNGCSYRSDRERARREGRGVGGMQSDKT